MYSRSFHTEKQFSELTRKTDQTQRSLEKSEVRLGRTQRAGSSAQNEVIALCPSRPKQAPSALEKYGGESQDLAMQQLAGKAPIDNILAVLQPEFGELSAKMKLASIVESPGPDPKAATVDVTSLLMDWLKASAETRKMAVELHQHSSGK
jgi:hypothetical protein